MSDFKKMPYSMNVSFNIAGPNISISVSRTNPESELSDPLSSFSIDDVFQYG